MKSLITFFIVFIYAATSSISQSWIPQGHGLLPIGYTIWSTSVVHDTVIWMTASDEAAIGFGNPIPLDHVLKVLRSVDGGKHWDVYNVSLGRASFDIVAVDANTAWMTTRSNGNGIADALFKTEDGGSTWINKLIHPAAGTFIRKFDEMHLLCQRNDIMARSDDGGDHWLIDTLQPFLPSEFIDLSAGNNLAAVMGDTLWVGTTLGRVVRYTSYGASFEMFYTGVPNVITAISFEDHLRGMLFYFKSGSSEIGLMRTFDGGSTWESTPSTPQTTQEYNITHVPGTTKTYVAVTDFYSDDAEYFWTTDFGETWIDGGEIKDAQTNCVQFLSPTIGWASTGNVTRIDEPIAYQWSSDIFSETHWLQKHAERISVSPNPASDYITYTWDGSDHEEHYLTLTNANGEAVVSKVSVQNEIDIRLLPSGIYYLGIQSKDFVGKAKLLKLDGH